MKQRSGQTLVLLMVFAAMAIVLTTATIAALVINTQAASKFAQANTAYDVAEAGAENAVLRLLRDPGYPGEVLTTADGTATIGVQAGPTYTITSTGQVGNYVRKIEVQAGYTNNVLTVTSWQERWN